MVINMLVEKRSLITFMSLKNGHLEEMCIKQFIISVWKKFNVEELRTRIFIFYNFETDDCSSVHP